MLAASHLLRLYEAVYREPPSFHSMADLLAMEEILGLQQDDPLARMLIVLLRSAERSDAIADRVVTALNERSQHEEDIVQGVKDLAQDLVLLADDLHNARLPVKRHRRSLRGRAGRAEDSVNIDVYRKASPLLSYLRWACRPLSEVVEEQERVLAARWDCFYIVASGALLFCVGLFFGG